VAPRGIAVGQWKRLARAVAEGARRAGVAGEGEALAGARAAGPGESPGARYEDPWARGRASVRQGCWAGRAADGCAGIRRARSWAPRVPCDRSSRVRPSAANSESDEPRRPTAGLGLVPDQYQSQYCLPCRLRLLLISCKLTAARRWAMAAALLPRLIASCGAGATVVYGQSEGGSEWLSGAAANWYKGLMWRAGGRSDAAVGS
jgi:hypothetical protein